MCHKERKMGTMVERIQHVTPVNFLYNMVQMFVNMGNALTPSRLLAPFGARHENTGFCRWGVFHPKKRNKWQRAKSDALQWTP